MTLRRSKSGRRCSSRNPARAAKDHMSGSTPVDPRVHLPLSERKVSFETLNDGTVVTNYLDPPRSAEPLLDCGDAPEDPLADNGDAPEVPADDEAPPAGEGTGDPWERLR